MISVRRTRFPTRAAATEIAAEIVLRPTPPLPVIRNSRLSRSPSTSYHTVCKSFPAPEHKTNTSEYVPSTEQSHIEHFLLGKHREVKMEYTRTPDRRSENFNPENITGPGRQPSADHPWTKLDPQGGPEKDLRRLIVVEKSCPCTEHRTKLKPTPHRKHHGT